MRIGPAAGVAQSLGHASADDASIAAPSKNLRLLMLIWFVLSMLLKRIGQLDGLIRRAVGVAIAAKLAQLSRKHRMQRTLLVGITGVQRWFQALHCLLGASCLRISRSLLHAHPGIVRFQLSQSVEKRKSSWIVAFAHCNPDQQSQYLLTVRILLQSLLRAAPCPVHVSEAKVCLCQFF